MPTYDAGSARLTIVPDASEFKKRLEADLKRIKADFAIQVSADTAQARADIDRFRELQNRNGIKVPIAVALAQAQADMERFRAQQRANDIDVKVNVDTPALGRARKELSDFESVMKKISDIGPGPLGNAFQFGGGLALLGELPAASTAVVQFAAALQTLAQAGLAIPGIIAGVGASIGTLALGISGISDAYSAVSKAATSSGTDQASAARAAASAQNQLRNATVDNENAHKDLSRAFRDAREQLEDLNLSLRGGEISEQQAVNDALRQRRDLQHDLASGQIKDGLDLEDRQLSIEAADQRVAESHQRNIELQGKVSDANQKGISGSDQVVAANERIVRTEQELAEAQAATAAAASQTSASQRAANEAMANLSDNGRELVNTLIDLKPQFDDLRNTVQDNLFAGVSQEIRDLVAADLPGLKTGLSGIASAWNQNIGQILKSLGSDQSKGLLDRILGNTAEAQSKFTQAIDPLVRGIGTLTAAGTDALPRLVEDFTHLAEKFADFIEAADKDGRLDKWINDGITGFEHFGSILLNLGTSFTAITKAAGGGEGLLGGLDRLTERLSNFLNSTEGQNKLKQWFEEGSREIRENIIPLLIQLPGVFKGVVDVGTRIADIVVPPLRDIAKFLGDHKRLIGDVVIAFAAWKTIEGIATVFTTLQKISDLLGLIKTNAPGAAGALGGLSAPGAAPGAPGSKWGSVLQTLPLVPLVAGAGQQIDDRQKQQTQGGMPDNIRKAVESSGVTVDDGGAWMIDGRARGAVQKYFADHPDDDDARKWVEDHIKQDPARSDSPPIELTPKGSPPGFYGGGGHFKAGGPTPSGPGPLSDGGYHAVVHPSEWMVNARGRATLGDAFLSKANVGMVDISSLLPHFDGGGYIDPYGNPITPGNLPGPSDGGGLASVAPNPAQGGVGNIVSHIVSGLQGVANTAGSSSDGVTGFNGNVGLPGLANAGGDPAKLDAWGSRTGDWLGKFGAKFASSFATTLFQGALSFAGLDQSILSPSNPYFGAIAKSLNFGLKDGQSDSSATGTPQLGSQTVTLGDGSTITVPTYGTSGTPGASSTVTPASAAASTVPSGSGVERWRATFSAVLAKLGLPQEPWLSLGLKQMQTESGGNPTVVNRTDSNAAKGTPSVGLMQVIGPTFDANVPPGFPHDVTNPESNIAAAITYTQHRYGGPSGVWGQGHGYDSGGWLMPGLTLAQNNTGKPEPIFSPQQWDSVHTVAKQAAAVPPPLPAPLPPVERAIPGPSVPAPAPRPAPVPQPNIPAAPPPPAEVAPQQPQQPQQPAPAGPAPVAQPPSSLDHNAPGVETGIKSAAAAIGNAAAAAASFGIGGVGGGAAGSLIQGLFGQAGKIGTDIANVGSSFLVGTVTPGTTANQYGETLRPQQKVPATSPSDGRQYIFNGIDSRNVVDEIRLKDAQDNQAALAQWGG